MPIVTNCMVKKIRFWEFPVAYLRMTHRLGYSKSMQTLPSTCTWYEIPGKLWFTVRELENVPKISFGPTFAQARVG